MVVPAKPECGAQPLSANLRRTVQSLKELTGNPSDTEVYAALKDCYMDANEAAQKLLNQGLFHEVRRKRDKKKESVSIKEFPDHRKQPENANYRKQPENANYRKQPEFGNHRKQPENANYRKQPEFGNHRQQPENANHKKQPETESANHSKQPENASHTKQSETENANHRKQFETENANQRKHPQNANYRQQPGNANYRKQPESANHNAKTYAADRRYNNGRRVSFSRNNMHDTVQQVSREFRVVRDNRVNSKSEKQTQTAIDFGPASGNHSSWADSSEKSAMGSSRNHKHSDKDYIPRHDNRFSDSQPKLDRDINLNGHRKEQTKEELPAFPSSVSHPQTAKQDHLPSSSLVEGVCASPSDPVHVPSSNSRSPAIKREVGVVGGHRQSVESSPKQTSHQNNSNSNLVQGSSSTTGAVRSVINAPKKDQLGNSTISSQSASLNTSRAFLSQHPANRQYQAPVGHQKGALPSKEWRPKSSQMVKVSSPEMDGTPLKAASLSSVNSKIQEPVPAPLNEGVSEVSIKQVQNVIIAQHIRAPENDRCQLTFGSFGLDISSEDSASVLQATGVLESATTSGRFELSGEDRTQLNLSDNDDRNNASSSSSDMATEQVHDEEQTTSSLHVESYSDTGLGGESVPPFSASELQQHQNTSDLPNFTAFDPQTAYDVSYFRHVGDTVQEQAFQSQASHSATNGQASSLGMVQQQPPLAQMYPQLHLSHYANVMPYRQIIPPVYIPPMGLPGYSNTPTYAHPSSGSSYVIMPGGSSHLAPANIKYGVQQFKHLPPVSAAGFGNFGTPTGYAINAPSIVGSSTAVDDSSRLKYKDSNLYASNPQAETSEVWIQNAREHPGMQSAPYYNMQGQSGHHHPVYMQSHGSFNPGGAAQSSHMQFPGVYQPSPNPHHMAAQMSPATPGPQLGPYQQQQQLSHLNWATNF